MSEPLTSENKVLDEIAAERREQLGKHGWTPVTLGDAHGNDDPVQYPPRAADETTPEHRA